MGSSDVPPPKPSKQPPWHCQRLCLTSGSCLCLRHPASPSPRVPPSSGCLLGQDSKLVPGCESRSGPWGTHSYQSCEWKWSLFPSETCFSLLCRQAGGSSHLLPSVFSPRILTNTHRHRVYDCPFALKPRGISVFLLNGPITTPLLDLREREVLLSVPWWTGGRTQHTLSKLLEEIISPPQTLQLFWIPKGLMSSQIQV